MIYVHRTAHVLHRVERHFQIHALLPDSRLKIGRFDARGRVYILQRLEHLHALVEVVDARLPHCRIRGCHVQQMRNGGWQKHRHAGLRQELGQVQLAETLHDACDPRSGSLYLRACGRRPLGARLRVVFVRKCPRPRAMERAGGGVVYHPQHGAVKEQHIFPVFDMGSGGRDKLRIFRQSTEPGVEFLTATSEFRLRRVSWDESDGSLIRRPEVAIRGRVLCKQYPTKALAEFDLLYKHGCQAPLVRDVLQLATSQLLDDGFRKRFDIEVAQLKHGNVARPFVDVGWASQPHSDQAIARVQTPPQANP